MNPAVGRVGRRPPWAWRLAVNVVLGLLRTLVGWRVRVRPPEVIPPAGKALLVVFNHTSAVDAFLVAGSVWHGLGRWVQPLVKTELFTAPVLGVLVRQAGAVPVSRTDDAGREAAYDDAVSRLRAGSTVLIAPEGTTTHDGSLLPLRHGAARLALEAGVDVLVVTHFGAQRGFSPVVRLPERGAVVTMAMDVVSPRWDDDASSLTGRVAATMIDRSSQLRAAYPQPDPGARWWPPYSRPASPTATARENLERYRHSMADAVSQARVRMAEIAEEHELEERVADARDRAANATEELAARSRARAQTLAEHTRGRVEELTTEARERTAALGERLSTGVDGPSDHADGSEPTADEP